MANLVYRKSTSPNTNAITAFKGSPLTNDELDNNLFGIDAEVQTKAPINNAVFTGSTTIPNIIASGGTINNVTIGSSGVSTGAFSTLSTSGNAAINGGSITSTATTFNLVNTTATTVNFAGASTAIIIGATTGTATIRNANLQVDGAATLSSTLGVTGNLAVNNNKFTVAADTGNTAVAGTLGVNGLSTLNALTVNGITTLTNNLNATTGSFSGQVTSTLATGTAPFVVASTTKVANLNADSVDGFSADQANTASAIVVRDASKNINISNAVMSGATSGTTTLQPTAISGTSVLTLPAATDTLVGKATTDTLTNKTVNLASNTLTGTLAQFNTALSDSDFVSTSGTETLTNKTVNLTSNTLTGTLAQFNTALSDADFVSTSGTETLTNKTLTSPTINTATIVGGTINNTVIGGTTKAAGSFTTLSADTSISSSANISGLTLTSTATTGTAPLTVTSTTKVVNLNADSVDGISFAAVNTGGVAGTDQRGGVAYALDASNITYVPPGTSGRLLQSNGVGAPPTWIEPTGLSAGSSALAANISGGLAGQLLYQGAADTTSKLTIGAANTVLTSSGTAPQWSTSLSLGGTLGVTGATTLSNTLGVTGLSTLNSLAVTNAATVGTTLGVTGATTLSSTLTHGGLSPSAGTNVDQLYTATDTALVVTTGWVSTSVNFAELATGSYMVQVSTGTEFYTGMMSWYAADINSVMTDEIILHRASAGTETSNLFLRVERTDIDVDPAAAASLNMTLQVSSSVTRTAANYTYKFRRMI